MKRALIIILLAIAGCAGGKQVTLKLCPKEKMELEVIHRLTEPEKGRAYEIRINAELVPAGSGAELHLARTVFRKYTEEVAEESSQDLSKADNVIPLTERLLINMKKFTGNDDKPSKETRNKKDGEWMYEGSDSQPTIAAAGGLAHAFMDAAAAAIADIMVEGMTLILPYCTEWLPEGQAEVGREWDVRMKPGWVIEKDDKEPQLQIRMRLESVNDGIAVASGKVTGAVCSDEKRRKEIGFLVDAPVLLEWDTRRHILKKLHIGNSEKPWLEARWKPEN